MECNHSLVVKDGFSDTKAVKITLCSKCLEIKNVFIQGEKKQETDKEMWAKKEKREHKRALTMIAFNLFSPITEVGPMDRWLKVRDMRDIMLTDLYND